MNSPPPTINKTKRQKISNDIEELKHHQQTGSNHLHNTPPNNSRIQTSFQVPTEHIPIYAICLNMLDFSRETKPMGYIEKYIKENLF